MMKNRAVALGVVAGIVIVGGIILSIVMVKFVESAVDGIRFKTRETSTSNLLKDVKIKWNSDEDDSKKISNAIFSYPFWAIGLVFVAPGVLGLIAAFVQKRCLYVISSIFSILCLIIIAIVTFVMVMVLFVALVALLFGAKDCRDVNNSCECRYGNTENDSVRMFKTCAYRSSFIALSIAFIVVTLVSGTVLGVQFIMCCYYGCCAKSGTTGGVVLVQAQQPMLPPGDPNQAPPGYVYPPPQQYYDESAQSKA